MKQDLKAELDVKELDDLRRSQFLRRAKWLVFFHVVLRIGGLLIIAILGSTFKWGFRDIEFWIMLIAFGSSVFVEDNIFKRIKCPKCGHSFFKLDGNGFVFGLVDTRYTLKNECVNCGLGSEGDL
jgi:ribosomal protein S27AE